MDSVGTYDRMFFSADSFDRNLCAWGDHIIGRLTFPSVVDMFKNIYTCNGVTDPAVYTSAMGAPLGVTPLCKPCP